MATKKLKGRQARKLKKEIVDELIEDLGYSRKKAEWFADNHIKASNQAEEELANLRKEIAPFLQRP